MTPPAMVIPADAICIEPDTQPPTSAIFALARRSSADLCICAATSSICSTCESRAARESSESIIIIRAAIRPKSTPTFSDMVEAAEIARPWSMGPSEGGSSAAEAVRTPAVDGTSVSTVAGTGRAALVASLASVFTLDLERTGYAANFRHDTLLR